LHERIDAEIARTASTGQAKTPQQADRAIDRLKPIAGLQHQLHSISTEQYIELVAWSAAMARTGKQHLESPTAALKAIGCDKSELAQQVGAIRCGWRVVVRRCASWRRESGNIDSNDEPAERVKVRRRLRAANSLSFDFRAEKPLS
jgi:hypothetical protein